MLDTSNVHVLLFGHATSVELAQINSSYSSLGFLNEEETLRMAYSAADVFVAPSRMEAFGKTLAESLACGTPVVCFDATGQKDVVEHRVTGYKAKPADAADLAAGIHWVLELTAAETEALRRNAHEYAAACFDPAVAAEKYQALYREMLV